MNPISTGSAAWPSLVRELLEAGFLLHGDGADPRAETCRFRHLNPLLDGDSLAFRPAAPESPLTSGTCCAASDPVRKDGGGLARGWTGPLATRAVIKVSAADKARTACGRSPCPRFDSQVTPMLAAFRKGRLERDCVWRGALSGSPSANGMPELHKLTPGARRIAGTTGLQSRGPLSDPTVIEAHVRRHRSNGAMPPTISSPESAGGPRMICQTVAPMAISIRTLTAGINLPP